MHKQANPITGHSNVPCGNSVELDGELCYPCARARLNATFDTRVVACIGSEPIELATTGQIEFAGNGHGWERTCHKAA